MTRDDEPGPVRAAGGPGGPSGPAAAGAVGAAPVRVTDRCAGCGACLLTCPARAIRPVGGTLLVRPELCDGCGECVEICPVDAIDEVPDADVFAAGSVTVTGLPSNCSSGGSR
jgi:ferredoxin